MATAGELLDITNLDEVIQVLRKHHYSGAKLYEFGLSLGLLAPRLDTIKKNNANDADSYLLECLNAWLRQVDKVASKGGPTYETLIAALRSIGENAVADAIDREKHPACMIFANHQSALLQSIQCSVGSVAKLLRNEKVLSKEMFAAVKSTSGSSLERKRALLKAVQEAVCSNHQNLGTFAAVLLQEDSAAVPVADAILKEYENFFAEKSVSDEDDCFSDQLSDSSSNAAESKEISNEITVPPHSSSPEFSRMKIEFVHMFQEVRNSIKKVSPPIPIDDLKEYIEDWDSKLVPRLDHAQLLRDVLRIVREKCTLLDISLLEGIVSHFNIKEAETHIQKYKDSIDTFYEETTISSCLNEDFQFSKGPPLLLRETATFVWKWDAEGKKLIAVSRLIEEVQGEDNNFSITRIQETNSIEVTCFFPVSLTETLITRAHANLNVLKEEGLLHLTIGYHTVYDSSKDEVQELKKEEKAQLQIVENDQELVMSLILQQLQENEKKEEEVTEEIQVLKGPSQSQSVNESDVSQTTEQQELTNESRRESLAHQIPDEQRRESQPGQHALSEEPEMMLDAATGQAIQGLGMSADHDTNQPVGEDAVTDRSVGGDSAAIDQSAVESDTAVTDQSAVGGGTAATDQSDTSAANTAVYVKGWRSYPVEQSAVKEVMIIGSFGNRLPLQQYKISPKLTSGHLSDYYWKKEEINSVKRVYQKNPEEYPLGFTCYDLPGAERPKEYYLEKIKDLFINCKKQGVSIWYTGHGEWKTGNWCFKDGVITFQDIFGLYMDHLRGKSLVITSDCSYSGNWINECIKKLDEIGIPSCGHHTREQGVLLKIFTSCKPNEEATALCYSKEGVEYHEDDKKVWHWYGKKLKSGQTPMGTDFRDIYCSKPADESCEIDSTWDDRIVKYPFVYLVRGKDRLLAAWHYVLVDEDKVDEFKAKVATGTIDVAKYGKVLCSGWGKDPPKDIVRKIDLQYLKYINP